MNIRKLLFLTAVLALPAFAAEGVPDAATANDSARLPYGHQGAISAACKIDPEKCRKEMQARREQMCAQNPEKCKEMKARMEQRRAQCQADPEKCRKEMQARREQMCAQNPEKCREMKARMEQRRAQCQADPAKCEQERQVRMDERFRKADADGNGTLSRSEAEKSMPMLARRFDTIDANKDGQVTRDELAAVRKARHGASPQHKI